MSFNYLARGVGEQGYLPLHSMGCSTVCWANKLKLKAVVIKRIVQLIDDIVRRSAWWFPPSPLPVTRSLILHPSQFPVCCIASCQRKSICQADFRFSLAQLLHLHEAGAEQVFRLAETSLIWQEKTPERQRQRRRKRGDEFATVNQRN